VSTEPAGDDDLGRAVRALAFAARRLERSLPDLTLSQYRVLALVASGDERASRVAQRLAVAKPTVTAVVDGLVDRGLLQREAIEGDRRSLRLVLTERGRGALAVAEDAMCAAIGEVLDDAHDRDTVVAGLLDLDTAMTTFYARRVAARTGT
jgi:DNA-binding MarR family transcriptional regulator